MGSLAEEKKLYSEIQKKLFYIIPEKWESIYLYASIIDEPNKRATGEMYFYYFPKSILKKKAINCYEIPGIFNLDEDEYANLIASLYNLIRKLRVIYFRKKKKKWTNLTIIIENFQFKVKYDYRNLINSEFDSYERHVIWRYIYLKPEYDLLSKKDKEILKRYIEYVNTNKLPKKDVYVEGMYQHAVKNIVDFEKTLSVEEAIAQANENEEVKEKKKGHNFLKKKKMPDDIIEVDDDSKNTNNQILNWKKK